MIKVGQEVAPECSKPQRHWAASLNLRFAKAHGRTRLAHCLHKGPLRVQRLFYPEPGVRAHCYVLHPPGGVVLGDELAMDIALADGSVLLTTPSAGRFYGVGSFQERQVQRVRLSVQAGELAWLPQETLVFAGANAQLDTHIDLGPAAQLCYWDLIVLGQPAGGQRFDRGCLQQNLEVCRGGRPLLRERLALHAGDRFSQSPIGLDGCSTFGIFLCTDALVEERVDHWLALVNGAAPGAFTFSRRDGLSIARYRGEDAAQGRRGFAALWESIEIARSGRAPAIPRVWHT